MNDLGLVLNAHTHTPSYQGAASALLLLPLTPPTSPGTLRLMNDLGLLLGAQGKSAEAEALHREALEGYGDKGGSNHPDTT